MKSSKAPNPRPAAPAASKSILADELERILRSQLEGEQLLLKCVENKRQAIRTANIQEITAISAGENTIVQRLAELEKRRLEIIGALTAAANPNASQPLTITQIAEGIDDPQRTRLLAIAAQLRDAITQLRRESSILRVAAETLNRHMTGIVQSVQSTLCRARIYGQRGSLAVGSPLQSIVDLKS